MVWVGVEFMLIVARSSGFCYRMETKRITSGFAGTLLGASTVND